MLLTVACVLVIGYILMRAWEHDRKADEMGTNEHL
jgi:hypothetical protein